jgi:hypothetical protein
MKGLPERVEGPMGRWYQKVNALIAKAKAAKTVAEVREILGDPDETIDVPNEDRRQDKNSPIDPRYPGLILVYRDPYRKRIKYRFDVSNGRIIGFSKAMYAA